MAKKKSVHYTLDAWEVAHGELTIESIRDWIIDKKLSPVKTKKNIEEFRLRMVANGNNYADFTAAFKVWFTKGWLAYTLDQAKAQDSLLQNRYYDKGVNL